MAYSHICIVTTAAMRCMERVWHFVRPGVGRVWHCANKHNCVNVCMPSLRMHFPENCTCMRTHAQFPHDLASQDASGALGLILLEFAKFLPVAETSVGACMMTYLIYYIFDLFSL